MIDTAAINTHTLYSGKALATAAANGAGGVDVDTPARTKRERNEREERGRERKKRGGRKEREGGRRKERGEGGRREK